MLKYWKKETENGTWLHIQKGFEWGNDLLCCTIEHLDGYTYETDEGEYIVSVRKAGGNIVEGSDILIQLHVTIDWHGESGVDCVFNEYYQPGENIVNITNDLHDQNLEELEFVIYREFIENIIWGTYCPMTDDEHRARGYVEITHQEAEELAALAGYDELYQKKLN